VDIYSFALIVWELITRKSPFGDIHTIEELVENVVNKEIRPEIPEGTPVNLGKLIKKCWTGDPTKRPAFSDIVGLFDLISLGALVNLGPHEDKNGLKLWKTFFMTKEGLKYNVSFEEFCKAYCEAGKLTYEAEDTKFKCLKAVLVRKDDIVTIEEYGALLQRFGPLDDFAGFLDRIVSLLKKTWFHGDISSEDSEKIVMSRDNGTFLVRFSSDPGSYAVTAKTSAGKLKHFRIHHKAGLDYLIGQIECKSLEEIIKKYHKELGLKSPAPGSPYEPLFTSEKQKKKQQMTAGYQVAANIN